jgi:outer membrane lipoprotein carrier protein
MTIPAILKIILGALALASAGGAPGKSASAPSVPPVATASPAKAPSKAPGAPPAVVKPPVTLPATAVRNKPAADAGAAPGKDAATPAATTSLVDLIARVQSQYDATKSYRADFAQAQLNATFGRTSRSSGEVLFKKPGFMRWNYKAPETKMFVSDGAILWLYEPADNQAFKQELSASQLPAALAFLMGKGKLAEEFDIKPAPQLSYGRPEDIRLSLKPKKPQAQYKSIYFIVDPATFRVRQTVLVDAQGNINDITFSNEKLNPKLPDATFKWTPPKTVRVVDTGAMGKPR